MMKTSVQRLTLTTFLLSKVGRILKRWRSTASEKPANKRSSFLWPGLFGEERLRTSPLVVRASGPRRC
jgi:hypothetical protein